MKIRIPAVAVRQFGVTILLCGMNAAQLGQVTKVSPWNPDLSPDDPDQGYQRGSDKPHKKKLVKYLLGLGDQPPLLPTSIICNDRHGNVEFADGFVTISGPIEELDGRHRTESLIEACGENKALGDVELPVAILMLGEDSIQTERRVFINVNSRGKKVKVDLAIDNEIAFFNAHPEKLTAKDRPRYIAALVAHHMNEDRKSTFRKKIAMANAPKFGTWITFGMAVSSLKSVVHAVTQAGFPSKATTDKAKAEYVFEIVRNFWAAIERLMPEPFRLPEEYFLLTSSGPGVPTTHGFLSRLIGQMKSFTADDFYNLLKNHPTLSDADKWLREGGDKEISLAIGGKGAGFLVNRFEKEMTGKTKARR